jgi:hypothetical protein
MRDETNAKPDCPFCVRHCNMRFFVTGELSPYCIGDDQMILFYRCPTCKRQHVYSFADGAVPDCLRCCVSCRVAREKGNERKHMVYLEWEHNPNHVELATKWDGN